MVPVFSTASCIILKSTLSHREVHHLVVGLVVIQSTLSAARCLFFVSCLPCRAAVRWGQVWTSASRPDVALRAADRVMHAFGAELRHHAPGASLGPHLRVGVFETVAVRRISAKTASCLAQISRLPFHVTFLCHWVAFTSRARRSMQRTLL